MKDVYLLSGFLGSGKTTLLKNFIRQLKEKNIKPAILMNELGALGFDSDAVEDDVPLRELLEGCICCSPSEKTEAQLQQILYQEQFDVLLIETTGAAHPVAALDVVLSPLFADYFRFRGIVTVVDSLRFLKRNHLPPQTQTLFIEQIRHAHLLVLNKTDLLPSKKVAEVTFAIQQINPHAQIIETQHANVNIDRIEHLTLTTTSHEKSRIGQELLLGSRLDSLEKEYPQYIVEDWVSALPDSVYRIKGYVQLPSTSHPHLFQYAYGMIQWLQEDVKVKTQLVLIGEQIHNVITLEDFVLLRLYKQLYPTRERAQEMQTIDEVKQAVLEELRDELSHPRVRKTREEKYEQLIKKVQVLDCSLWEERQMIVFLTEILNQSSTDSD
ncbi:CobW family GTP-binding protein [Chryseomicrobium palamuruense]|uniref:CobW family GTP-binding protein n=1 Tax=Chryseomicrobium palamuruense TaxID=682973 RepID=A0ABV8UTR2_9BACL